MQQQNKNISIVWSHWDWLGLSDTLQDLLDNVDVSLFLVCFQIIPGPSLFILDVDGARILPYDNQLVVSRIPQMKKPVFCQLFA